MLRPALLALLGLPGSVLARGADLSGSNVLNGLAYEFIDGAGEYVAPLEEAARSLYWSLLGISVVLTGCRFVLRHEDLPGLFAVFVRLCLNAGIFLFLIDNGRAIGVSIVDSLSALTDTRSLGPSELLDLSFNSYEVLTGKISDSGTGVSVSVLMYLAACVYLALMFLIVISYSVTYVSAYVLCVFGMFCLGFGAFEFTRAIAVNVLRLVIYHALKLMTIIMICNTGCTVIEQMCEAVEDLESLTMANFNTVLFTTLFVFVLVHRLPHMLGSLALGAPSGADDTLAPAKLLSLTRRIIK